MQHPRMAAVGTVLVAALVPAPAAGAEDAPPLPGRAAVPGERADVPGEGAFDIRITPVEQGLRVGDPVEYTVRVENTGQEDFPEASIVQLLPPDLEDPAASDEGVVGPMEADWKRGLPAEEETFVGVTGHVGPPDEDFERLTTIACVRPRPGAGLVDCASHTMSIAPALPIGWIAGGLVVAAVAAGGGTWWRRRPAAPVRERPLEVEIEQVEPQEGESQGAGLQDSGSPGSGSQGAESAGSGESARPVGADRE